MCNAFIRIGGNRYRLIILSQRDELLDRATTKAQWNNNGEILSGIDLQDSVKGTWFGVNRKGRVGVLLSITQPQNTKKIDAPSRGGIVNSFLSSSLPLSQYTHSLLPNANLYNGFQFLGLDINSHGQYEMESLANLFVSTVEARKWDKGIHIFGNCPPEVPFKKLIRGRSLFEEALEDIERMENEEEIAERLIRVGEDEKRCLPDPQLSLQTNLPESVYAPFGALKVAFPPEANFRYGTRCYSVYLIDNTSNAFYLEKRLVGEKPDLSNPQWETTVYRFKIDQ